MAGLSPIRVVVGEDQPIFRDGIVHVLRMEGFEVVGTAGNASELMRQILTHQPDVAITDIQMPPDMKDDGLQAVIAARRSHQKLGVLVLSQFLEDRYALDLVADGSHGVGYLLKEKVGEVTRFTDAVRRVSRGETVLDPEVVAMLVGRRRKSGPLNDLTSREWQVLELIAQGRSNAGIAQDLTISVGAVEHNVTHIFEKLGLRERSGYHRRVLAVLEYLKQ